MQMPPTTITIPNNTTLPQKEDAMATNAAANNEISPTGVDAFDSHFNFNNDNNNNTDDAIIDKSTSYHDHQHNHPSSLITSSYPTTIVQQHPIPIITSNIFSTTSPLLEQHPIQIQLAAMEFIQTPTNANWKYLVHLFRVERRKKEEEEQYQQQMQHQDDPSLEADEQQEEDQRDDVVLDYVATMPIERDYSVHIKNFDVAYDNEKDDSTEHEEEVDDEQSVDNDSDVQEESVNSIKDETKVVEQVSVDSNNEEEEEEGQEVTITEEEPINGVEEEGQEVTIKEAERINDAQETTTTTTTTTLVNHSTSSNKSSSTTTSNKSSSSTAAMLTGRNGSNKYDHRDWMAAFRLIYQLLWLSKAWVELTAFVNRFCTRRR